MRIQMTQVIEKVRNLVKEKIKRLKTGMMREGMGKRKSRRKRMM